MKISKVNNSKLAVKSDMGSQAFLYKNPVNGESEKNIDINEFVLERIKEVDEKNKEKYDNSQVTDERKKQINDNKLKKWNKKKEYLENTVAKSIINQDLVVQPKVVESGSETIVLAPAVINDSKKEKTKEAFSQFLFDFAVLDETKRTEMLWKIRRLVLTFFYGERALNGTTDKSFDDLNNNHKQHRDREEHFVDCNLKKKNEKRGLKKKINYKLMACYKKTLNVAEKSLKAEETKNLFFDDMDLNTFWVKYIENSVKKLFNDTDKLNNDFKLRIGYISEKVWKSIINYMSIKYIALGKTVYNTAMSNIDSFDEDGVKRLGVVDKKYAEGISSFELENIKAEENFQRDLSMYINFAVRHLTDATIVRDHSKEDILFIKKDEDLINSLKDDPERNILQFFGGRSIWINENKEEDIFFNNGFKSSEVGIEIIKRIRDILSSLRNDNFHFTNSDKDIGIDEDNLIGTMLNYEAKEYDKVIKKKYYSNNVPMFYSEKSIKGLMEYLYESRSVRATQMPSFANVIKREKIDEFTSENYIIKTNQLGDKKDIWRSSIYFVLKEIYYNSFVNQNDSKKLFFDALDKIYELDQDDENHKAAMENFRTRIGYNEETNSYEGGITNYSLPEICQIIMTDYNQYNNQTLKKKTSESKKENKGSYEHYVRLLYKAVRYAFASYINNDNKFDFLKNPRYRELEGNLSEEDFLNKEYEIKRFDSLTDDLKENTILKKWYVLGKMLSPKQLNHLAGAIKTYLVYKADIIRRANETGNPIEVKSARDAELKCALMVLEMCIQLSGRITQNVTDYFKDEDDFANYVSNFLDFDDLGDNHGVATYAVLKDFCMREINVKNNMDKDNASKDKENGEVNNKKYVGIFFDGKNPIVNRNIVMSKMYGASDVMAKVLSDSKLKFSDIEEFYNLEEDNYIKEYKENKFCTSKEMQIKVKEYQSLKNHIEFRDLVDYSELLDELLGQLIKWSYLRERDLMYFQLGFHYACLNNSSQKPELYQIIKLNDGKIIEGAILYQIVALNTFTLPVYYQKKNGNVKKGGGKYSDKYNALCEYSKNIFKDCPKHELYITGLQLFEVIDEHEKIIELRNDIEHFKYYHNVLSEDASSGKPVSILNMYSEVFDRFFTYDIKLHKNVPNVFSNILLNYFVGTNFDYMTGTKLLKDDKQKESASLRISKKEGIWSDLFTYKIKVPKASDINKADKGDSLKNPDDTVEEDAKYDIKEINYYARDDKFVSNVGKFLVYPEEVDATCLHHMDLSGDKKKNGSKKGRPNNSYSKNNGRPNNSYSKNNGRSNNSYDKNNGRTNNSYGKNNGRTNNNWKNRTNDNNKF